jgi:PAS domain S-box-containing protein
LTAGLVWHLERQSLVNVQHASGIAISLLDVLSDLEDVEARERVYLQTGEQSSLAPYNSSRKALDDEFDRLQKLTKSNPKEKQEVERLRYLVHQKLDELQTNIDARAAARLEAARAMELTALGKQLTEAIRQDISDMEKEGQNTLAGFSRKWESRVRIGLAALVGSALVACCWLLISRVWLAHILSQRHRAEEALHTSERRFETLCEQAPLGIYEADAEGRCIYTNRRWSATSGLSATESLGHGWAKVLHPDDRARVFEGWLTAAQQGTAWEYRLVTPTGEMRWVRGVGGPIYSPRAH